MKDITPIRRKFGARVREQRMRLGMSQEGLADKADLHRTYIGAIERGEQNIALDNIAKLAKALRVKPRDLFENI